jgi:hypothetical protein
MGEPRHSKRLRYLSITILYFIIKMEQALYELENRVLPHLEDVNLENPEAQHCLEEVRTLLDRVRELLHGTLTNPEAQYQESLQFYRSLAQVLPLMVLLQSFESPPHVPDTVDNLPGTPSSDQSDEDSFWPGTPPLHLET